MDEESINIQNQSMDVQDFFCDDFYGILPCKVTKMSSNVAKHINTYSQLLLPDILQKDHQQNLNNTFCNAQKELEKNQATGEHQLLSAQFKEATFDYDLIFFEHPVNYYSARMRSYHKNYKEKPQNYIASGIWQTKPNFKRRDSQNRQKIFYQQKKNDSFGSIQKDNESYDLDLSFQKNENQQPFQDQDNLEFELQQKECDKQPENSLNNYPQQIKLESCKGDQEIVGIDEPENQLLSVSVISDLNRGQDQNFSSIATEQNDKNYMKDNIQIEISTQKQIQDRIQHMQIGTMDQGIYTIQQGLRQQPRKHENIQEMSSFNLQNRYIQEMLQNSCVKKQNEDKIKPGQTKQLKLNQSSFTNQNIKQKEVSSRNMIKDESSGEIEHKQAKSVSLINSMYPFKEQQFLINDENRPQIINCQISRISFIPSEISFNQISKSVLSSEDENQDQSFIKSVKLWQKYKDVELYIEYRNIKQLSIYKISLKSNPKNKISCKAIKKQEIGSQQREQIVLLQYSKIVAECEGNIKLKFAKSRCQVKVEEIKFKCDRCRKSYKISSDSKQCKCLSENCSENITLFINEVRYTDSQQ